MSEFTRREYLALTGAGAVAVGAGYIVYGKMEAKEGLPQCDTEPPADLDAPTIGEEGAEVTVGEYTDFTCPHCKEYVLNVFPEIQRKYIQPGKIKYKHYDFPIPVTQWSRDAANAARSVQYLGDDEAFFKYATALYQHQGSYSYELFNDLAEVVGVSGEKVEEAARKGTYCTVVNESKRRGLNHGVSRTPTVFVNEEKLVGPSAEELSETIEKALP